MWRGCLKVAVQKGGRSFYVPSCKRSLRFFFVGDLPNYVACHFGGVLLVETDAQRQDAHNLALHTASLSSSRLVRVLGKKLVKEGRRATGGQPYESLDGLVIAVGSAFPGLPLSLIGSVPMKVFCSSSQRGDAPHMYLMMTALPAHLRKARTQRMFPGLRAVESPPEAPIPARRSWLAVGVRLGRSQQGRTSKVACTEKSCVIRTRECYFSPCPGCGPFRLENHD